MSDVKHLIEISRNAEGDDLAILGKVGAGVSTRIAGPKAWGGSTLLASIEIDEDDLVQYVEQECGIEPDARSDQTIIDQTNALAHQFLKAMGFETNKSALLYDCYHMRGRVAWDMAAMAQEYLTDTDVENAAAALELEPDPEPGKLNGTAFVIITSDDTTVHSDDYDDWLEGIQGTDVSEVFRANEGSEMYDTLTKSIATNTKRGKKK